MLFERVLTEEANRKSAALWEHYLAFEFEMGDLQSALRLEKRAREALGDATGAPAGAGASARNIQLLLLRYQFGDSCPCPPGQKQYLEYLMGKGPPPPGFERQPRSSKGGSGPAGAAGSEADRWVMCRALGLWVWYWGLGTGGCVCEACTYVSCFGTWWWLVQRGA